MRIHSDLYQGTEEWIAARCGMLTASEMSLILTPTFKPAKNEKERSHLYELLAQRITGYVEPRFVSDDMLRGQEDEVEALALYAKHYAETESVASSPTIDGLHPRLLARRPGRQRRARRVQVAAPKVSGRDLPGARRREHDPGRLPPPDPDRAPRVRAALV